MAERFGVMGLSSLVVGFEYGGDGETVLDPHGGRRVSYERARIQQMLSRRSRIAQRK